MKRLPLFFALAFICLGASAQQFKYDVKFDYIFLNSEFDRSSNVFEKSGTLHAARLTPLVGDRVVFRPGEGEQHGWLEAILPRRSELIRPPVANIDLIGVVRDDPEVYYPQVRFQFRLTNRGKEPVSFGTDALYVNGFGDFTAFTPVGDGFIERWWEMPGDCVGYMELNRDMDMIRCPVESVGFFMETPDENERAASRDWIEFAVPGEGDEP